jgi:hypothetical protein
MRKYWGSCSNFMMSYGLKPWNADEREEALAISRVLALATPHDDDNTPPEAKKS